jgi:hypothetical protein
MSLAKTYCDDNVDHECEAIESYVRKSKLGTIAVGRDAVWREAFERLVMTTIRGRYAGRGMRARCDDPRSSSASARRAREPSL